MTPARRPGDAGRRPALARALACIALALISIAAFAASGQASAPPGAPPPPGKKPPGQPSAPPAPGQHGQHNPTPNTEAPGGSPGAGTPPANGSAGQSPGPGEQPGSSNANEAQNTEPGPQADPPVQQHPSHSPNAARHQHSARSQRSQSPARAQNAAAQQNAARPRANTRPQESLPKSSPEHTRREKNKRTNPRKGEPPASVVQNQPRPRHVGRGATPTATASATVAPASGSTAPAASPPSSAPTGAPATPGTLASAPVVAGLFPQAAGPSGHGRHAGPAGHPGAPLAAGLAGGLAVGAAPHARGLVPLAAIGATAPIEAAADAGPAPKHPRRGSGAHGGAAHQSPLATTITRIVDVVPTPVRVLFGVLLALALGLAVRAWLSSHRARRLEQQRTQLLADVGLLQAALLPIAPDHIGPVGTSAAYRPAAGPAAGGDFYDVFALEDGRVGVIVGDISGHGRDALPHTALVRYTLRAYLEAGLAPRAAVQTAGAVLDHQLGGSFATVLAATYQPRERRLVYASAGHPPPVILGSQPLAAVTIGSAPPLGAGMRTGTRQTVVSLPGRAEVCFHTDGVTEARVGSELFGSARLQRTLADLGPGATAAALLDGVAAQADARPDDMAACLLSIDGGASAPATLVEELELDRDTAASERTTRFLRACGVGPREAAEVVQEAQAATLRSGTVLLELRLGSGAPQVRLQQNNVTHLRASRGPGPDRAAASS